ncbi:30S ribosomal protein S17 [Candidatus Gottesmanbacteria bacterium RBG_13_45_10]|uniref:Small ribosomal subunit protein uS17 n=1 Tax=Candidatus Gottesmanbacteria bacterium RBG_13_45_10 TaxID=1798370 RepID=A0A1F5ZHG7_9BACT|nr:MAG: 30S ribosomal protein S17 [Candidatus Gottesmanbacteria bacterium RBG_13_45_10]
MPKGKVFEGSVVSTKTPKTIIVEVTHSHRHPLYKKAVKRSKRFSVHNESIDVKEGDKVRIIETKPISKRKHFRLLSKIG